jgi:predicted phosphodiesterase
MEAKSLCLDHAVDRLVVVSDLHAFLGPLHKIDEWRAGLSGRSQLIVNGDLFSTGTEPLETLRWVRERAGEFVVAGNHDEEVLQRAEGSHPLYETAGVSQVLTDEQRVYVGQFPYKLEIRWRDYLLRLMHGHRTLSGQMRPPDSFMTKPSQLMRLYGDPAVDLTILGHTHFAFVRRDKGVFLANCGSVSLPILAVRQKNGTLVVQGDGSVLEPDGDLRSTFLSVGERRGTLEVEVVRFSYNHGEALQRLEKAGYPHMQRWRRLSAEGVLA